MNEAPPARWPGELLFVLLAMVASIIVVWFATGDLVVLTVFVAGTVAFSAVALSVSRRRTAGFEDEFTAPDWSVTVAAIERPDTAIAITDRAGRLVCANSRYETWFGIDSAPPDICVAIASREPLVEAIRGAWRDGVARLSIAADDEPATPHHRWQCQIQRAGRGSDFLVWSINPQVEGDPVSDLAAHLDGKLGVVLSSAGIYAALVDSDGKIRAVSTGFAQRALGDSHGPVEGAEFVSMLQQEDGDRISWARDGQRGSALMLYQVPIIDPDQDAGTAPSLMLLVDAGLGVGAGESTSAAVPHLEALLGQLPLGLAMADRDGRLLFANAAFMRAALSDGQSTPTYPTDLVVKEDKRTLAEAIRRFGQGPAAAGDIAIRLLAQPDDPVSLSLAGVRGLGDAAVLLSLTDSSEETRLKRQVAQATKMQAVGQLAGGVAHDFNNVLTAILGTCDLMLMRHTPGDSDYDDIQQIRANSNRAASLTRQLLAFSRQQTLRPEVLQLPDVVADVSQMLRRLIGEKVQFVVTHDRDLGPVRADPTQLEQVIVNLVVNARDAVQSRGDGSGRVTLSTRKITPVDVRAMRSEIMPIGEYTALCVDDTGNGIAPEHLGKIFEPFFTTKEQGKGTGLGLSTVYGIVKQSGGFIFAESKVGIGTKFSVYLPVEYGQSVTGGQGLVRAVDSPVEAPKQWAGGGRILLVEDEDPVRVVAERALTRQGYQVISARDGEEGLEHVQKGGQFDLVVSDVVMPSMDGPAMARHMRKVAPNLPVLFMSGYAEEQLRKEIGISNAWFMPKPFSVQQLSEKVGDVLARSTKRS